MNRFARYRQRQHDGQSGLGTDGTELAVEGKVDLRVPAGQVDMETLGN
jgi:hypothetical protein